MKKIVFYIALLVTVVSCGQSYQEHKQRTKEESARAQREDSLALKVAVMPTLDCLPLFVAKEYGYFDTLKVDVRLRVHNSPLECAEDLAYDKTEGAVTDVFHVERLRNKGKELRYVSSTDAYWQAIANRSARIKDMKQMEGKMITMSRYSVTDYIASTGLDSAKLDDMKAFKIQIHNPRIAYDMLRNNEVDVAILPEPYATEARLQKNPVIIDTKKQQLWAGVIAFSDKKLADKRINAQYKKFVRCYDMACDSINARGIAYYTDILNKYYGINNPKVIDAIPKTKYHHARAPRQEDVMCAEKWVVRNKKR